MQKSKKIISLLLSLIMTISIFTGIEVSSVAEDDILSYLTYEINGGEVTITGCDNSISGDVVIPETIEGYPVRIIDSYTFKWCNFTSIIIPDSVTTIYSDAFYGCYKVESVFISKSVSYIAQHALSDVQKIVVDSNNEYYSSDECGVLFNKDKSELICFPRYSSLTEYIIPDSVTTVGSFAFYDCEKLSNVTIPDSVTMIESGAFYDCESLTNVTLGNNVTSIGASAFYSCSNLNTVTLGNSVTTIGDEAFYGCNNIENINIPATVTSIGINALNNVDKIIVDENNELFSSDENGVLFNKDKTELICFPTNTALAKYEVPEGVTTIGDYSFSYSYILKSIVLPDSVTTIGDNAFYSCENLYAITIPNSVTTIGDNVFDVYYGGLISGLIIICNKGSYAETFANENSISFIINGTTVSPEDVVNYLTYIIEDDEVIITDCKETIVGDIVIPDTINGYPVTTIGDDAFKSCHMIERITLPDGITRIGKYAFSSCDNLANITIGDNVASIDDYAFYNCDNLGAITIPASVTSIGEEALKYCKKIIVDENNAVYSSDEYGVLFNKDKTELLCFPKYNSLTEYEIPDTVITIGTDSFSGCKNLLDIIVSGSVTTLKSGSFAGCGINKLELPYSVKKIEPYVLAGFSSITINYPYCDIAAGSGKVDSISPEATIIGYSGSSAQKFAERMGNTFIALEGTPPTEVPTVSGDDILEHITYEITDGNVTITDFDAYIGGKIVIPDTIEGFPVTSIYNFAFDGCYWLTSVIIPDSVTDLQARAFSYCYNLENVTIGKGITGIHMVFSESENLSTVYYKGTAEEWASISIYGDDYLKNATIIYNWQEPTTEEPTTEEPTTKEPETEVPTTEPTTKEPETEVPTTEPTTKEPETEVPTTEPTTKEPETEVPTTEPTTKEPETEVPTTEPTTKEPETEAPTTEPTTKEPVTEAPTTEKPTEKPTEAPTQKPVSDKLEVSGDTVKVEESKKVSTVKTKSTVEDVAKSITNVKYAIVDKNGNALKKDALVGTGSKIEIMNNSGNVVSTYTVVVPNDVDGNGKTTAADARLALRGSAKLDKIDGVYATASDANGDGKITAADARKILRISAGLENF